MNHPKPKEWDAKLLSQRMIADYKPFNFVDGEGVRNSLYVSGCLFACEGCFNKAVQNFNYGTHYTEELEAKIMADLSHSYVQGLTLLGGEPFLNTPRRLTTRQKSTRNLWRHKRYLELEWLYL